jgi:hypothetical protein
MIRTCTNINSMLYHTAIGQLFRPMLKIDLINFRLKPRDACIEAANMVSELLRQYRSYYPMRTCQLVLTHILLSNCIVHLTFSKDAQFASSSYRYLVEGLQALEDLSICHWFGARAWKIIYETSKAWDLGFPEELRNSKLIPKAGCVDGVSESSIVVPRVNTGTTSRVNASTVNSPASPSAHPTRRESLSMFTRPDRKNVQLPSHSAAPQRGSMLRSHRGSLPHILPSYSANSTPQTDIPASHPSTGSAETLFWNPIPTTLGVPILPRNSYPVGPMDLDNMLGNSNVWDRFSRDGFKMSETWNHDQANAYGGSGEAGYPQVSGDSDAYAEAAQFNGAGHMNGHVSEVQQGAGQSFDASWWSGEGNLER